MTSRRDAIRTLAGFAALPLARKLGGDDPIELGHRIHEAAERRRAAAVVAAPRALTRAEYETVVAAAEAIIPRTATPGATDAHVADFVDVMLADWYEPTEAARFRAGLAELDARARSTSGATYAKLTPALQTKLLESLDSELQGRRASAGGDRDEHWFATLKHLTVWGYYTSRVGIEQELGVQVVAGHYDGNAPY